MARRVDGSLSPPLCTSSASDPIASATFNVEEGAKLDARPPPHPALFPSWSRRTVDAAKGTGESASNDV